MTTLLILCVILLSFANGANDNFKGVATLWGSGLTTYQRAIAWATGFTFLGSLGAIWLGSALAAKFSGAKFVDASVAAQLPFLIAVALGAGCTVLLAGRLGLPISTTHSITGALVGAGVAAAGFSHVKFAALGKGVVLPLLFSPLVALVLTVCVQLLMNRFGWAKTVSDCVCVDEPQMVALAANASASTMVIAAPPTLRVAPMAECQSGVEIAKFSIADGVHWFSAAAISFARGLNDTPKIAALLLVATALGIQWGLAAVAVAIAVGGLLNARKVAETMSHKITGMNPGQGFAANLATALLVTTASSHGLPVSTTHVSVGSLLGIGIATRQAKWKPVLGVLLSWIITLPCAAVLAAIAYLALRPR